MSSLPFTSLLFPGWEAQFHEGMRVVAPKAGDLVLYALHINISITNQVVHNLAYITVDKLIFTLSPEIWI